MPGTLEDPELLELLNTTFAGATSSQSRTRVRDGAVEHIEQKSLATPFRGGPHAEARRYQE